MGGEMGTVNSFNWNGIGVGVHLANQDYDVCIRQRADACRICWAPITTGTFGQAIAQGSFGVSNGGSGAAAPKSGVGAACNGAAGAQSNDFVTILGGNPAATNIIDNNLAALEGGSDVFCGRYFAAATAAAAAAAADATVCSRVTPFRLGVHFDGHEAVRAVAAGMMPMFGKANADEASGAAAVNDATLGIFGFSLGLGKWLVPN